jgi:hypothetical protein
MPACDRYPYAVVDPTQPGSAIALCEQLANTVRSVVRLSRTAAQPGAQTCEVLVDGPTLGNSASMR